MNEFAISQSEKYCVFRCYGDAFALPAVSIRSVTPTPKLSPLPLSPGNLVGLAYVHQEFLPVFDLAEFVGAGSKQRSGNQQMLVINADQGAWGILIDQVLGLETLEISYNGPREDASEWAKVNVGSASFHESFVSVIQPEDLFNLFTQQLRTHWQELVEASNRQTAALEPSTA